MNNFRSMKYSAILLPALAMGISVASAGDDKRDDPCDKEQSTATATAKQDHGETRGPIVAGNAPTTVTRAKMASKDNAVANASDKAKANAADKAAIHGQSYLENQPANNFFSSNLIGQEVKNKRNDEVIGTVEEILIDKDGQVAAVILSTGGLMGLGEKDVAIAWDQIERTMDDDDEIELSVDFSEASLEDAPAFSRSNPRK